MDSSTAGRSAPGGFDDTNRPAIPGRWTLPVSMARGQELRQELRHIRDRVATFHGAQLLTREWASPCGGEHVMFVAESDARDADGSELLSAYVVRRPGGTWSTLLVNKDPVNAYRVTFRFAGSGAKTGRGAVLEVPPYSLTVVR